MLKKKLSTNLLKKDLSAWWPGVDVNHSWVSYYDNLIRSDLPADSEYKYLTFDSDMHFYLDGLVDRAKILSREPTTEIVGYSFDIFYDSPIQIDFDILFEFTCISKIFSISLDNTKVHTITGKFLLADIESVYTDYFILISNDTPIELTKFHIGRFNIFESNNLDPNDAIPWMLGD